jgi:hypothetical protein
LAAFVRAVRPPFAVGGREEKHRGLGERRAVFLAELGVRLELLQAVRKPAAIEAILEVA